MDTPWPTLILDVLEALDAREEPHGLFGRAFHTALHLWSAPVKAPSDPA